MRRFARRRPADGARPTIRPAVRRARRAPLRRTPLRRAWPGTTRATRPAPPRRDGRAARPQPRAGHPGSERAPCGEARHRPDVVAEARDEPTVLVDRVGRERRGRMARERVREALHEPPCALPARIGVRDRDGMRLIARSGDEGVALRDLVGSEKQRPRLLLKLREGNAIRPSGGRRVHKARGANEKRHVGARRHDVGDIGRPFAVADGAEERVEIERLALSDAVESRLARDVHRDRDHVFARPAVRARTAAPLHIVHVKKDAIVGRAAHDAANDAVFQRPGDHAPLVCVFHPAIEHVLRENVLPPRG